MLPQHNVRTRSSWWSSGQLNHRDLLSVLILTVIALVICSITYVIHESFDAFQQHNAELWYSRGEKAIESGRPGSAAASYRTALMFSRGNRQYQLRLAQALEAAGHDKEAKAYFSSLWDAEPGNGVLNLELARIAARQNEVKNALRYFHGAIYGVWPADVVSEQSEARLELIDFLLQKHMLDQAESELIAVSPIVESNPGLELRVAADFMTTSDFSRALQVYEQVLQRSRQNVAASAGAGEAAIRLHDYAKAQEYLEAAIRGGSANAEVKRDAGIASAVTALDPYERGLSTKKRNERILSVFQVSGSRLQSCFNRVSADAKQGTAAELQQQLQKWQALQHRAKTSDFRYHPDLADDLIDFAGQTESVATQACGQGGVQDAAVALITKIHDEAD